MTLNWNALCKQSDLLCRRLQITILTAAGSSRIGNFTRMQPGDAVGEFFGYKVIGYFKDAADVAKSPTQSGAAPGAFKFADINGDGAIDR